MNMVEALSRVFGFSYDERVYNSDVNTIVNAARMYPNSKVYCYQPGWTSECQIFVLADNPKHAMEIYSCWCGKYTEKDIKESDFELGDSELEEDEDE